MQEFFTVYHVFMPVLTSAQEGPKTSIMQGGSDNFYDLIEVI